ncbi:MAG: hypothetical protein IJS26_05590 [Alphaproteobacteria bacterium]|nr:hypothetical protein [Alphaproteobacteria bacterium]
MTEFINKLISWYMRKTNRCFFAYDTNEYLVLKRTDKKSVFYDLHGKKWSAFERSK